jgi:hypothetical protein
MAEMEARIGLAQWGPSDARSEEASQALALARGMKHLDGLIRAASIVVDHTSDPNEQSGLLAEAVDCMEQLRSHAPSDKEGVLEDPVRLSLCRRYLAHLREGRGPDPDEWLEKMAWPPIAE